MPIDFLLEKNLSLNTPFLHLPKKSQSESLLCTSHAFKRVILEKIMQIINLVLTYSKI